MQQTEFTANYTATDGRNKSLQPIAKEVKINLCLFTDTITGWYIPV